MREKGREGVLGTSQGDVSEGSLLFWSLEGLTQRFKVVDVVGVGRRGGGGVDRYGVYGVGLAGCAKGSSGTAGRRRVGRLGRLGRVGSSEGSKNDDVGSNQQ